LQEASVVGQKPENGGGGSSDENNDPDPDSGKSKREKGDIDHADREFEDDHEFLDAVGLKRLRMQIDSIWDPGVRHEMFAALHEARQTCGVDDLSKLIEKATAVLVDRRDLVPQDVAVRDAEYKMMAINAVVNNQPAYAVTSAAIPIYDAIKVAAWAIKDFGDSYPGLDGLLGGSGLVDIVTSLPEYALRTHRENPTTRPGIGGFRALDGVRVGWGLRDQRDLTWDPPIGKGCYSKPFKIPEILK
jgi:hypothetical protein